MGTIFLERTHSPFDILVRNFYQQEEEFTTPNNRILNHPVDIYEDKDGLYFDIACTGLTKKQIEYCANDVIYLHKIYDGLYKILVRENRLDLYNKTIKFLPTRKASGNPFGYFCSAYEIFIPRFSPLGKIFLN